MKRWNQLGIGVLAAGLACGWAGLAFGADEKQPPAGERPRPEGREGGGAAGGAERGGQRPEPGRMLDRMREMYNEKLNLSDEQKKKVDAIIDKAKTDLEAAMKDTKDLEPRERGEKMRGVMGSVRESLMDVLDSTQQEKLREEMKKQFGDRRPGGPDGPGFGGPPKDGEKPEGRDGKRGPDGRGEGRPGRPGGPDGPPRGGPRDPGAMIGHLRDSLSKVGLNDEQKKKVEALLTESEKKMSDLQTEAEKQAAETRGKFREAMQSQRAKLDEILTSEQKEKLKELMPPRPEGRGEGRGPEGRGGEGRGRGPRGGGDGDGKRPAGPPPADGAKPDKQ